VAENVGRRGSTWFYRVDLPPGPDGRRRQKRESGPHLGRLRLAQITASTVQQLYGRLRASGGRGGRALSGTQTRNVHRVLHNMLAYAVRMGYLVVNPTDSVEKPADDTAERPVNTPEQAQQFLWSTTEDRLRALWHLVLVTGLRRAELAGLRWRDLNLEAHPPTLTVRSTRTMARQVIVETDPKTRAGRRVLVLDRGTVGMLQRHRAEMEEERAVRGEAALSEYVFVSEMGQPLNPAGITRRLHVLQAACGLPLITFMSCGTRRPRWP